MKLKKYYADNMQEALKVIKDDIGQDAVIISSKFIRTKKGFLGLFSKKQIEVVAGYEEKPQVKQETGKFRTLAPNSMQQLKAQGESETEKIVKATGATGADVVLNAYGQNIGTSRNVEKEIANKSEVKPSEAITQLEGRIAKKEEEIAKREEALEGSIGELKALINNLTNRVESYGSNNKEVHLSSEVRDLFNRMTDRDVERSIATEMCTRTETIAASRGAEPKEVLSVFMTDMLGEIKPIQCTKFKRKIIMIIGPTGVGKTTTLVKLASKFLCEDELNVGIINADVFRVAAKEHLKAYCDILNMDLITIYKPEEITDALLAFAEKDIVFIDTAGKLSSNKEYQDEIGELVSLSGVDEIYLLVSASTSEKVIKSILKNYAFLNTHNIIITKVDEVSAYGVLFNIAKESGRPLSYITTGQSVPDDIKLIEPKEIVSSILEN